MATVPKPLPDGVIHHPGFYPREAQQSLLADVRAGVAAAPLYVPTMPRTGKPLSVRMTNFGTLGWVSDKDGGYRYQPRHPVTGNFWPPIPKELLRLWHDLFPGEQPPQACLVNFYTDDAKMGLHQDSDETNRTAPVLSVSLGNACLFRIGGTVRNDPTQSYRLESGDVMALTGPARDAYHGVDRIYPDTNDLLIDGGRLNLTLRRVR